MRLEIWCQVGICETSES